MIGVHMHCVLLMAARANAKGLYISLQHGPPVQAVFVAKMLMHYGTHTKRGQHSDAKFSDTCIELIDAD